MQVILFLLPSFFLCGTFAAKNDNESIQNLIERLGVLETEVKQLRAENANLKNADDSLEKRVEKLEELSKFKTLRSCQELSNRGLTKSGVFDIDPDGDGIGYGPITVYCNFETNETSIYHDREDLIKIEKCETEGCAVYEINYNAPDQQIQALIELSDTCHQDIDFGCFLAPLRFEGVDLGYWSDKNGNFQYFFSGNGPEHTCQCGIDGTCVDSTIEQLKCNCDAKDPTWYSDIGRINAKELLPITAFQYGPLKFDVERANVTLGRLTCKGSSVQVQQNPISCNSLKLQGVLQNGIYTLQGQNQEPRLAFCDMSKDGYTNGELETPIGLVETWSTGRPMFAVSKATETGVGDIIFDEVIQDTAKAYDTNSGVYKVPQSGIYSFSFMAHKCQNVMVYAYKNGYQELLIYYWNNIKGCLVTGTSWIMDLQKGDEIVLRVDAGSLLASNTAKTAFSGYLREER